MRDKKGIGAVFAWIFILLAGALIITIFIILAQGQAVNAKNSLSQKAFQNVNTIITTQQTTSNIATSVPIPESRLRLSCTLFEQNSQVALLNQLDIGGYSQPLDTQLIVGRDMQADRLNVFSKKWQAPFTVANILYVSSPEEILVYTVDETDNFIQKFNETIPENINVFNQTTFSNAQSVRGYQNVRIVHISDSPALLNSNNNNFPHWMENYIGSNALFIHVESEDEGTQKDITDRGVITYYEPVNGELVKSTSFEYVGEAMMLAYIWQGDADRAACLQHKLAHTLNAQIDIQLERMAKLRNEYGPQHTCFGKLSDTTLQDLQDTISTDPTLDLDRDGKLYDFSGLHTAAEDVEKTNNNLRVGESCATIY